tara:strand:- start:483 stop:653 length:171 start_codon:yes stop_codon:yes gene_type:complete
MKTFYRISHYGPTISELREIILPDYETKSAANLAFNKIPKKYAIHCKIVECIGVQL